MLEYRAEFGITSLFESLLLTVTEKVTVTVPPASIVSPVQETTPPASDAVQPWALWQSADPAT